MIGFIEGTVQGVYLASNSIILLATGVGYEIHLPTTALTHVTVGMELSLHISTQVREDAITLYGFTTRDERSLFHLLLSINKVGAKTALAILSCFSLEALHTVVNQGDTEALTRVPGIGKKTAQHIFFELQYKMKDVYFSDSVFATNLVQTENTLFNDAFLALSNLGYEDKAIYAVLPKVVDSAESSSLSLVIKNALKELS